MGAWHVMQKKKKVNIDEGLESKDLQVLTWQLSLAPQLASVSGSLFCCTVKYSWIASCEKPACLICS